MALMLYDSDYILVPYTVLTLDIRGRLIGDHHTLHQRHPVLLHADALRALMHAQIVAYTVAGAVQVHPSGLHDRATRQDIQQTAPHSLTEHSHTQVYHAFKDSGIVIFLPLSQGPERYSPGSVGCTVGILRTRVNQQKALRTDDGTSLLRRHIMRHGGVRT